MQQLSATTTEPIRPATPSEHSGAPPGARGLRLGAAPTVSIVVASRCGLDGLDRALEVLRPVCREHGIEIVVVRAGAGAEIVALGQRYPDVLFMPAPDGCPAQLMRGYGLAAADGDIVVMTDDARPPDAEWLKDTAALTVTAPRD